MRVKAQNEILIGCSKRITLKTFRCFQDRPSCCLAAPDEDENSYLNPSLREVKRRGNLIPKNSEP